MEPGTQGKLIRDLERAESSTKGMSLAIQSLGDSIRSLLLGERAGNIHHREQSIAIIRKEYREALACFETMQAYIEQIDPTIRDGK